MNNQAAQQFLQIVNTATNGLPKWSDPDVVAILTTEKKTGKRLIVTSINDDGIYVRGFALGRAEAFASLHNDPIYYHGWWATLETLGDFQELRRDGKLYDHASIVSPIDGRRVAG